jgi:hypothetical protein
MRDQRPALPADDPGAMGIDDITFEDLLADEPDRGGRPMTFKQLLADGFPHKGGLEGLATIEQMRDPGPQLAEVRRQYLQILKMQRRAASKTQ